MSPSQLVFSIQPGAPRAQPADQPAADVADALQAIFPLDTDDAILNYNRVAVRLGYRYDVSVLIDDLLPLLSAISREPSGEKRVQWGSDTFQARWDVRWAGDELRVDSRWAGVSGDYEDVLNERPTIEIPKAVFLAEWGGLLTTALRGIEASGVRIERADQLETLRLLAALTLLDAP